MWPRLVFKMLAVAGVADLEVRAQHQARGEAPVQAKGTLKVASLNLQGFDQDGSRLKAIAAQVVAELGGPNGTPDVFVLQEAMALGDSSTAHRLADELRALGVLYHVTFKERKNREGDYPEGLAILSKRPIPAEDIRSLDLSSPTREEIGGARWWPRVALSADFEVPGLGRVRVVNTHHESNAAGIETRRRQVGEVQDWIAKQQAERPAQITVLGGDFNPDVSALDFRRREFSGLTQPAQQGHLRFIDANREGGTWKDPERGAFTQRLDYVFVNEVPGVQHRGERLIHLQKNGKDLTDHLLLVQDFAWY